MVRLRRMPVFACLLALYASLVSVPESFGQSGIGAFRAPVRSTLQNLRPKNWPVFQNAPTYTSPNYSAPPQTFTVCQPGVNCPAVASVPYATSVVESIQTVPTEITVVPSSTSILSATATDADAQGLFIDRIKFRQQLMKVNREAYRANEISLLDMARMTRAANNPQKLDEMLVVSREAAIAEGMASTAEFPWTEFFALLERLLPILLQLIGS